MLLNPLNPEWPQEVAALIERVVGKVRSLFTNRAVMITNALVFGAIAIVGAAVAVVLAITMLFRAIQSYLTWDMGTTAQIIIGVLALVGLAMAIAGLVTAKPGVTAGGALIFLVAGTKWILDITETFIDHDTAVWISYMIIGGWLILIGLYFMLQRRGPRQIARITVSRDVIIIGSGPAGLTAAIYTARANLAPLVIEGEPSSTSDQPGGQLMLTTDIENFPGFPVGITGPELMTNMREQAARFGAEFMTEKVTAVDFSSRPFKVDVRGTTHLADAIIVATGAQSIMLGLDAETRLLSHGLSTCATCDGFFFRGQEIAVVGGGDSALEEATFLTKFATKVTVIHRRDTLRASKIMQERAFANDKIEFLWNHTVVDLVGEDRLTGAVVRNTVTDEVSTLDVTGMFIAIGHSPNTAVFHVVLDMDENGYVLTQQGSTRTSIEGVFACGDVQDHTYRQAITAAGSGCMAAIDAERWLESVRHG